VQIAIAQLDRQKHYFLLRHSHTDLVDDQGNQLREHIIRLPSNMKYNGGLSSFFVISKPLLSLSNA